MAYTIGEFDISKLSQTAHPVILIIGPRRSGKSTLVKNILSHIYDTIPLWIIMNGLEKTDPFYGPMIPPCFLYDTPDINVFHKLIERQSNFIPAIESDDPKYAGTSPRVGLVIDDCIKTTNDPWTKSEDFNAMFTQGRHVRITLIVVLHSVKCVPPIVRSNVDYLFIFNTTNYTERRKIRDEYVGMISNKRDFGTIFDKYTEDFACLAIDNVNKKKGLTDKLFYYRANDNLPAPALCASIYRKVDASLNRTLRRIIYMTKARKIKKENEMIQNQ